MNTAQVKPKAKLNQIRIRLAANDEEIRAAQELRYKIFYEEYGALPSDEIKTQKRDFDQYDEHSEHLIVTDEIEGNEVIVGTYRLLTQDSALKCGQFYSESEYNIDTLKNSNLKLLELGRSCVAEDYRARPTMQLLWQGIVDYMIRYDIDVLFGCASLHSTDIDELAPALSYLYHYHKAPGHICTRALDDRYIDMNIIPKEDLDAKSVFSNLPPLIKGYMRIGAFVGDGAVIDPEFQTTDVCIIAKTDMVAQRYRKHFERKVEQEFSDVELSVDIASNKDKA
ncbi:MAG: GNAT family N-acyltransferase [Bacteroidota bacterium]